MSKYDPVYMKRWREANKDKLRAYWRKWWANPANKEARKKYHKKWRDQNPDKVAVHMKRVKVKSQYGLTLDEYENIVARPCAVCGVRGKSVLDHCHRKGNVRGALCPDCNRALGMFKDDPKLLKRAVRYLERGVK